MDSCLSPCVPPAVNKSARVDPRRAPKHGVRIAGARIWIWPPAAAAAATEKEKSIMQRFFLFYLAETDFHN